MKISPSKTPTSSKLTSFTPIESLEPDTEPIEQAKIDLSNPLPVPTSGFKRNENVKPESEAGLFDVSSFLHKMSKYQIYMANLERRNADLQILNAKVKSENSALRSQLELARSKQISEVTKIPETDRLSPLPRKSDCILSTYFAQRPQ